MKHWTIAALVVAAALSDGRLRGRAERSTPSTDRSSHRGSDLLRGRNYLTQAPAPHKQRQHDLSQPISGSSPLTYTVKAGDVCWRIAEEHGVTTQALMEANPRIDANCSNLGVGGT